jgi:hypothetical protein
MNMFTKLKASSKANLISEWHSEPSTTNSSLHHHKDKLYVILWIEADSASWMASISMD